MDNKMVAFVGNRGYLCENCKGAEEVKQMDHKEKKCDEDCETCQE